MESMKRTLVIFISVISGVIFWSDCKKKQKDYHIWLYMDNLPYIEIKIERMKTVEKIPQGKRIVRKGIRVIKVLHRFNIKEGKWVEFYGKRKLRLDWSSVEHPLYKVSLIKEADGTYTLAGVFGVLKDTKQWVKSITGINVISSVVRQRALSESQKTLKIFFRGTLLEEIDVDEEKIAEETLSSFIKKYDVDRFSGLVIKGPGRELKVNKVDVGRYFIKSTKRGRVKVFLKMGRKEKGNKLRGRRRNMIKNVLEIHIE